MPDPGSKPRAGQPMPLQRQGSVDTPSTNGGDSYHGKLELDLALGAEQGEAGRVALDGGAPAGTPRDLVSYVDIVMTSTVLALTTSVIVIAMLCIGSGTTDFVFPTAYLLPLPWVYKALNRRGYLLLSRVACTLLMYVVVVLNAIGNGSEHNTQLMLLPVSIVVWVGFRPCVWRALGSAAVMATYIVMEQLDWEPGNPAMAEAYRREFLIVQRVVIYIILLVLHVLASKEREALIAYSALAQKEMAVARAINAELERDGEAKMRFLAVMSHEIRTPLNGIIGLTDVLTASLSTRLVQSAEVVADLDLASTIASSSHALLTIVNDLLDFSRVDAGHLSLVNTEVDLGELVENVCHSMVAVAENKGLELVADVRLPLAYRLVTDPVRVQQVLSNLVGNALKFTHAGYVRVRAELCEQGGVRLSVQDTGQGIPAADLPTIFEPFTQVEQSTKRRFDGTGLGLAISKRIVGAMGGRMGVESTVDVGTKFWVLLEDTSVPSTSSASARQRLAGSQALNVLVLGPGGEDNPCKHAMAGVAKAAATLGCRCSRHADIAAPPPDVVLVCTATEEDVAAARAAHRGTAVVAVGPASAALGGLTLPLRRSALAKFLASVRGSPSMHASPTLAPRKQSEAPLRGVRVLAAEDNVVNCKVLRAMLLSLGCELTLVTDGAQCVEAMEAHGADVILMDCHMPVMDGFEASKIIHKRHPAVPIVALTADVFAVNDPRATEAGMVMVLTKPVTMTRLGEALSLHVRR